MALHRVLIVLNVTPMGISQPIGNPNPSRVPDTGAAGGRCTLDQNRDIPGRACSRSECGGSSCWAGLCPLEACKAKNLCRGFRHGNALLHQIAPLRLGRHSSRPMGMAAEMLRTAPQSTAACTERPPQRRRRRSPCMARRSPRVAPASRMVAATARAAAATARAAAAATGTRTVAAAGTVSPMAGPAAMARTPQAAAVAVRAATAKTSPCPTTGEHGGSRCGCKCPGTQVSSERHACTTAGRAPARLCPSSHSCQFHRQSLLPSGRALLTTCHVHISAAGRPTRRSRTTRRRRASCPSAR